MNSELTVVEPSGDSVMHRCVDGRSDCITLLFSLAAGGSIYYGIEPCESGSYVRGVKLPHTMRDRLRLSIDKLVVQCIILTVAPGTVMTKMHNVLDPLTGEIIPDLRVIG